MDEDHATRLHRAVSWLRCAGELQDSDDDVSFITSWIAFNACYAIDTEYSKSTFVQAFKEHIAKVVALDEEKVIYNILWFQFSKFIRTIIDNHFIYRGFWDAQKTGDSWEESFEAEKKYAYKALANNDVQDCTNYDKSALRAPKSANTWRRIWQSQVNRAR